jgi:hypothetical protein
MLGRLHTPWADDVAAAGMCLFRGLGLRWPPHPATARDVGPMMHRERKAKVVVEVAVAQLTAHESVKCRVRVQER